ncbi:hypothetical protein [Ferrimonas pelagia]|uniref:Cytochrome c assembly protein domain-containing protein n=1 Tax=Ferrimonas pelagia TaxID=1177826 RepID=A0ABP9ED71_9GAMM
MSLTSSTAGAAPPFHRLVTLIQPLSLLSLALVSMGLIFDTLDGAILLASSNKKVLLQLAALLICLCALVPLRQPTLQRRLTLGALSMATILLIISTFVVPHSSDNIMLTYLWAHLFFVSRPLAVGFALISAWGLYLTATVRHRRLQEISEIYALLAGTLFLGGEIAGAWWAFEGWGRSWGWSDNFMFSAMVYLMLILAFHLPRTVLRKRAHHNLAQAAVLALTALTLVGYRIL